jgi:G3E family GTPase
MLTRRPAPLPVLILTGSLGAGKTTLLNAALRSGVLRDTAVVVNEFGAVGIDHALVEQSNEEVVLLPGGCVCCEVRADLVEALLRLGRAVTRGEMPAFERVVVETSGLAEPGPILQLFAESAALAGRYRLGAIVTLVDALFAPEALAHESETWRQVVLADRLLVTHAESVVPPALGWLEARLAELNPHAPQCLAAQGVVDATWFEPAAPQVGRVVPSGALRAAHDEAVSAFILEWTRPEPMVVIGRWLHELADGCGARLLRVKGIVAIEEDARSLVLHLVQHRVGRPEYLERPCPTSQVVLITRGLEPGDVMPPWPVSVRLAPST